MVPKSAFAAVLCAGLQALGGTALADEYRPDEFLRLDLPKVVLSPKRLGPEAEFAPVPIEAKTDRVGTTTVTEPKIVMRKTHMAGEFVLFRRKKNSVLQFNPRAKGSFLRVDIVFDQSGAVISCSDQFDIIAFALEKIRPSYRSAAIIPY